MTRITLRHTKKDLHTKHRRYGDPPFFLYDIHMELPRRVLTSVSEMQTQLRSRECDLFLLEKEVEELRAEMKYDFPT